jgi:hypothetical protein
MTRDRRLQVRRLARKDIVARAERLPLLLSVSGVPNSETDIWGLFLVPVGNGWTALYVNANFPCFPLTRVPE